MSSETPVHSLDKFILRLPEGMRERIGVAARANKRTMNAEIVSRLERSFAFGPTSPERPDDERKAILETRKMVGELWDDLMAPPKAPFPSKRSQKT
jgi:hypothetical protein